MEKFNKDKDYCSAFPEEWGGMYIGDCCYGHDEVHVCSTTKFYKCLKNKIDRFSAIIITAGGFAGCWVRHTKLMIKRLVN